MLMLSRRLQILLDDDRYERLARRADERGTSIATLVREAIDATWPAVDPRKAAAAEEILAAEPMPLPDVDELLAELDDLRARRK